MVLRAKPGTTAASVTSTDPRADASAVEPTAVVSAAKLGSVAVSARLRAGLRAVNPQTSVSYVLPVSEVAYVLLAVGAYVDVTGRFHLAQDTVTTADTVALDLSKPFADVAESSDSVALEVDFIRDFADTAALLDTTAFAVDRLFDDAQPVADSAYATFFKSLSDSVTITEQFSVAGAGIVDLTDSSSPIDQLAVSVTKPVIDSVSLTDSGTVLAQDYCDITYFAADYVGTAAYF